MDRILEKKPFCIRYRNYLIAGILFLAFFIYVIVVSSGGRKLRIDQEKVGIEEVVLGKFLEYVDAEGIVQPILTLKVNTREGGSVERIIGEEGMMLEKGDTILLLTNPELKRSIEDQKDDLDKQLMGFREKEIEMEQKSLNLKQQMLQAVYELKRLEKSYRLDEEEFRMGVKSKAQLEVSRDEYEYKKANTALQLEGLRHDSTVTIIRQELMNNDLEREKGITILAKNTAIHYGDYKINIIDTPGHADFGGEVERVLKMVNGVVLVVDAFEGPMPQTKFVLKKALELDLSVIVCINKVDRPEARPDEVVDETLELLMELDAGDKQLDCPFVFASAKEGFATLDLDGEKKDMKPLFETIIDHIEAPEGDPEKPLQVLISTIDYNEYVGRIGIGKVDNGEIAVNKECIVVNAHDPERKEKVRITKLYEFEGLDKVDVKSAQVGSIVAISGISDLSIGDTICDVDGAEAIPFQKISEPTISMQFMVNDSPLAGQEGKYVTSRHIRDRLFRELNTDVSLRVEESENQDSYKVSGRGELHLSVLIENMRREGYEFAVSKAEVLYHYDENGKKLEPMEIAVIDVPEEFTGAVIEKLSQRKGELQNMTAANGGYSRLEFSIPSRGLIGYRGEFMTDTKGNGILNTLFDGYGPYKGDIQYRKQGSLIAYEAGETITYGLFNAQERGTLFVGPGEKVYGGMVIGQTGKTEDIEINVCRSKKLTNTRASGSDDALKLSPPKILSLEQALEFIDTDELLEITPENIRIRKKILDPTMRKRAKFS